MHLCLFITYICTYRYGYGYGCDSWYYNKVDG